jgi:hypothetical protein
MEGGIEEVVPIGEYETLMKRIQRSERLNGILFFSILVVTFLGFITIGIHTYRYERQVFQLVKEFKRDVAVVVANQNAAIGDLNQVVLNRDWLNYQRLSLEQLQDFYELAEADTTELSDVGNPKVGVGGK